MLKQQRLKERLAAEWKERVFDLRLALGFTQGELAEEIGVSRQTIFNWESGSSVPLRLHRGMLQKLENKAALDDL